MPKKLSTRVQGESCRNWGWSTGYRNWRIPVVASWRRAPTRSRELWLGKASRKSPMDPNSTSRARVIFKHWPGSRDNLCQQLSVKFPTPDPKPAFFCLFLLWVQRVRKESGGCPLNLVRESPRAHHRDSYGFLPEWSKG